MEQVRICVVMNAFSALAELQALSSCQNKVYIWLASSVVWLCSVCLLRRLYQADSASTLRRLESTNLLPLRTRR
jgi:hypothetical protein